MRKKTIFKFIYIHNIYITIHVGIYKYTYIVVSYLSLTGEAE